MKKHVRRSSLSAGGILKLSRSLTWALLTVIALQTPGSIMAMEQEQPLSQRKQNLVRRLVANYKETRELYKKRKAGKASPEELKKLDDRMKTIKKAAIKAGVIAAFIAALAGGRWAYKRHLAKTAEEEKPAPKSDSPEGGKAATLEKPVLMQEELLAKSSELYDAVRIGNYTMTEKLLKTRVVDPNIHYQFKNPLLQALKMDDQKMIQLLLDHGANPWKSNMFNEIRAVWGDTAAETALRYRNKSILTQFLNAEKTRGFRTSEGNTLLHIAFRDVPMDEEIAKFLISLGADTEAKNNAGETPHDLLPKKKELTVRFGDFQRHGEEE